MLFPTFTFAVFFLLFYGGHVALRRRPTAWKVFVLGSSLVFYGWWDWRFCGLLLASAVGNWWAADRLHRSAGRARRRVLRGAVVADLAVLGVFKYYGFFVESLADLLGPDQPIPLLDIVLPVGISFFTFQAISYVVDVHRRDVTPATLLDVAVYLSFFPQLVAGPIVRAGEFLPQLRRRRAPDTVPSFEAAWLIGRGLFKKVVVATYLGTEVVDPVFAAPSDAGRLELVTAVYGYAIQIYADFSGYTDIAIGIALLLGFRFPDNFDDPYRSRSFQEFWRRWHITLSTWLRDYLYIPLGGNRGGRAATSRNLLATMVLGGLWHGAAWTFVVWGLVHGLALVIERLWRETQGGRAAGGLVGWVVTFHVVCLAWIPFRADTFGLAADVLAGLVTAPTGVVPDLWAVGLIVTALGVQLLPAGLFVGLRQRAATSDPVLQGVGLGAWIALVVALGPDGVAPFIYFQF